MLQLNVGRGDDRRSDDRLGTVVCFSRNRNDRLARGLRIRFCRPRLLRAASVECRKIFRGLIVNRRIAFERRPDCDSWLKREESRHSDQQGERNDMACGGLQEASPGKTALDNYVRPERLRRATGFERWEVACEHGVPQIAVENLRPRRKFDQEPRNGHGLRDLAEGAGCGHLTYSRCGKRHWDSREDMDRRGHGSHKTGARTETIFSSK